MAEVIKFYKLISQYLTPDGKPEDITLNCPLKMTDMDDNFLAFKDNDIKDASYDKESMVISIIRNNGEKIELDISELGDDINERIEQAVSGLTPESGSTEINISGELNEDGTLVLTLTNGDKTTSTTISGFLTEYDVKHDETLYGDSSKDNPLRLSNVEKTGKYKSVIGIVNELPTENVAIDDRYITKQTVSSFGRLYSKQGMGMVKNALLNNESIWRVPTKEDWDKLLNYADECANDIHNSDIIGEYVGNIAGKVLKSVDYWEGNDNIDTFGFGVVPAGYVDDSLLNGPGTEARFWTDTDVDDNRKYIKGFNSEHDNVLQDESKDNEWYSLRLVADNSSSYTIGKANVLGSNYDVVNIPELKQAWISTNLIYNPGDNYSEQYTYDYEGIAKEKYVLNHWNGKYWEKKELGEGDEINIKEDNGIVTYVCTVDESGNQVLVKGLKYKDKRMVIDAGWY
jgi:uncharacterized protein (TIGR02145 family)